MDIRFSYLIVFFIVPCLSQAQIEINEPIGIFEVREDQFAAEISPDGNVFLSSGSYVNRPPITLWDVSTGEVIWEIEESSGGVTDAAFSPDNQLVALSLQIGAESFFIKGEGQVNIYNRATGELIQTLFPGGFINEIGFSPDSRKIAVVKNEGGFSGGIRVFDINAGESIGLGVEKMNFHNLTGDDFVFISTVPTSIAFHPNGDYLLAAINDRSARMWDMHTGELVKLFIHPLGPLIGPKHVVFQPNTNHIISEDGDTTVYIWDFESQELIRSFQLFDCCVTSTNAAFIVGNQNVLFIGGSRKETKVSETTVMMAAFVDLNTQNVVANLNYPIDGISNARISSDGNTLLTANSNQALLWDISAVTSSNVGFWKDIDY